MRRIVRWEDWWQQGIEHLVLMEDDAGIVAEAVLLAGSGEDAYAARYRIECTAAWQVRKVEVAVLGEAPRLELHADGEGQWWNADGRLPALAGALDVDISATPFTNTIAIRRLALQERQSAEIEVAYVGLPDLSIARDGQRYTCLAPNRRYRYESLDSDFRRDIEVDAMGLVVTYPGLFRRLI